MGEEPASGILDVRPAPAPEFDCPKHGSHPAWIRCAYSGGRQLGRRRRVANNVTTIGGLA